MSREDILDTVLRGLLAKWGFAPEELHLALFARYGTVYKNLIASAYREAERPHVQRETTGLVYWAGPSNSV